MSEDDVERVRSAFGDRAARRYAAITDPLQVSLSDYQREGGAIAR